MQKRKWKRRRASGWLAAGACFLGLLCQSLAYASEEEVTFPEVHQAEQLAQGLYENYLSLPDGTSLGTAWFRTEDGRTSLCLQEGAGAPCEGGAYSELGTESGSMLYDTFSKEAVEAVQRILESSLLFQPYWESKGIPWQCTRQNAQMAVWVVMDELKQPGSGGWTTDQIRTGGLTDRVAGVDALDQLNQLIQAGLDGKEAPSPEVQVEFAGTEKSGNDFVMAFHLRALYLEGCRIMFQGLPDGAKLQVNGNNAVAENGVLQLEQGNGEFRITVRFPAEENRSREISAYAEGQTERSRANFHFFRPGNSGKQWAGVLSSVSQKGPVSSAKGKTPSLEGDLKLMKTDADTGEPLGGAVYGIYSDRSCTQLAFRAETMAGTGSADLKGLTEGRYYVKEISPPAGYAVNPAVYEVEIMEGKTTELHAQDQRQKVCLILEKSDEDTRAPLSGAVFGLYTDEACTQRFCTLRDEGKGVYTTGSIVQGTYYLKEDKPPVSYARDEKISKLNLTGNSTGEETVARRVYRTNKQQIFLLQLRKKDSASGKPLSGAEFRLYYDVECKAFAYEMEDYGDGTYSATLSPGTYYLREEKAPPGYALDSETERIELPGDSSGSAVLERFLERTNMPAIRQLTVTKRIRTGDIVFAHGNPVFLICLEGTDVSGKEHTYYRAVEFLPEDVEQSAEYTEKTVIFGNLPAGKYTLTEGDTYRYQLRAFEDVVNGNVSENSCTFDLTEHDFGHAAVYNEKIYQGKTSHTDLVINHFPGRMQ